MNLQTNIKFYKTASRSCFVKLSFSCGARLLTCVPRVVTVRPGQLCLEAVGQVEESPGQDDDVVHAAMQDHHLAGITKTCRDIHKQILSLSYVQQDYIWKV